MIPKGKPLPLSLVLAYAGIGIPLAAIGFPMAVFIAPMYADTLGLGTTLTGFIFMCLRFWDLGTDPMMGWLVDSKPTRLGRIKHWLIASIPVLMLATIFIFMPVGETVEPLYLVVFLALFWLGFTMLQTPHQAWVPMITNTYDERSRLFMWREIFSTITLLILLIIPIILALLYDLDRREQVAVMGIILLLTLPITVAIALRFVPDPPPSPATKQTIFNWPLVWQAFRDPAIIRIISVEVLIGIAIAGAASTFLFAAEWGFGVTELAPIILLPYFVIGFISMPFWVMFSKRTEKKTALMIICIWSMLSYLFYLPLSMAGGGATLLLIAATISGVSYGAPFVLIRSMMADVIEREQANSGNNRAGLYYSLMSTAHKTGASFAIGIPYILLGTLIGFDPNSENSEETIRGLMYVFIGVPVVSYALCALIIRNYPLSRKIQAESAKKLLATRKLQSDRLDVS